MDGVNLLQYIIGVGIPTGQLNKNEFELLEDKNKCCYEEKTGEYNFLFNTVYSALCLCSSLLCSCLVYKYLW